MILTIVHQHEQLIPKIKLVVGVNRTLDYTVTVFCSKSLINILAPFGSTVKFSQI